MFNSQLATIFTNLFWKYVRSNTKVRDDVDKLVKRDGTLTCSDRDVANCLNDFLLLFIPTKLLSDIPNLPDSRPRPIMPA